MRRGLAAAAVASLFVGMVLLSSGTAQAAVNGGCAGSADFTADSVGAYTPANDTRDNAIIVPKADGNVAMWEGSVPGENKDFGGKVEIRIGPAWIEVADWGFPDHNGENVDDERSDFGDYNMDELWDVIPKNIAQGIYEARASHSASNVNCDAQFFVKFEGNALESPIVIVAIILLVIFLVLLIIAGRARASAGAFKGRPVLAVIAAFFLAIMIAILLQQFCKWPLDNLTIIILPLVMIVIGLIIAKTAPFGGVSTGIGDARDKARQAAESKLEDAPDSGEIFEDGFESGDTSAWTDE
ncbi:MAG: hypothetical protein GY720_04880 [bacterium]|nr:hypothetical protein [bacterium]